MRKFLDGYYPMRVSMDVVYPDNELYFANILPVQQPGFALSKAKGSVRFETWFEGELNTEIRFQAVAP